MTSPLADAEALLAAWQERLEVITRNLTEIDRTPATLRLKARLADGRYAGTTLVKVKEAVSALARLSADYVLLSDAVRQAEAAKQGGFFLSAETRASKVTELLTEAWIVRSEDRVPIEQRDLLMTPIQRQDVDVQTLLKAMQSNFALARDVVTEIDSAEKTLSQGLDALKAAFAASEARAQQLHCTDCKPTLIELADLDADPLNAAAGIDAMNRGLASWARHLDDIEAAQGASQAVLRAARERFAALEQLALEHAQAIRELADLVGPAAEREFAFADDRIATLGGWLNTLESTAQQGQWRPVEIGGTNLNKALEQALALSNQALGEVRGRISAVKDLEGLFTALQAKASRYSGSAGHAEPEVSAARNRAAALLAARPMDWPAAQASVKEYSVKIQRGH